MINIYNLFQCTAESFPDNNAVIYNDTCYTFREVGRRVNQLAHGLYQIGLRPRMTIGLLLHNGVDYLSLFYAVQKLGCVLMPLNWRLTPTDQIDHINGSHCDALIYDETWSEGVASIKNRLTTVGKYISLDQSESLTLSDLYRTGDPEWSFDPGLKPEDPCLYLLTGGTSSNSKIAIADQERMMMRALLPRLYNTLNYTSEDNFLTFNPMFHQGGVGIYLPVSLAGGCLTMLERMDVEQMLMAIEKYRVTRLLLLPPSLCNRIKENPELQKYDLSSVRYVMLSGGASSGQLAQQVFETFPNAAINSSYGATENAAETMHVYTREDYQKNPKVAASVGKRSPFSHIKLVDEEGNEVGVNTAGECLARSYGMLNGYMGRPSPFVDGWFPTGDFLEYDENGYYYFKDRKNFLIKTGGECVIPSEVEQALLSCPQVEKAAVFGMPDSDFGEKVTAAVVLKQGEQISEEELILLVKSKIASYKKPKTIFFVDDLCYTTVGKVDKRALQALCAQLEQKD